MLKRRASFAVAALLSMQILLLPLVSRGDKFETTPEDDSSVQFTDDYISFTQVAGLPLRDLPRREAWKQAAPSVVEISIPRKSGEKDQPALWYHSGTEKKKPLLLVLHSWSANYLQHYSIPYGTFAEKNDWIFIHPNFRGAFSNEETTASDKVIKDVLDALDYAKAHAPVDEDRIYLAGFSGGAMLSLIMVGRYPDKFSAAVAWVPVYDLNDWYASLVPSRLQYTFRYRSDIEAACGGNPVSDDAAGKECRKRSPSTYLPDARGKDVKVFISGGVEDPFVPTSHAIRAFNDLAAEEEKISESDYRFIDEQRELPEHLEGEAGADRFFEQAGLPVLLKRTSKNATLVLFDGGHDIAYNAGLDWLSRQSR
jgi:predicted esterase